MMMSDVTTEELTEIEGGAVPWFGGAVAGVLMGVAFCVGVGIGNAINDAWGVDPSTEIHC
jgi:hypothetical protein